MNTIKEKGGILSNDNVDVGVGIDPDVNANKVDVNIQLCSCSITLLFHCFSRKINKEDINESESKNKFITDDLEIIKKN